MEGALKGIRVVELATMVAAPACGRLLRQMGAEVIKIEALDGDPYRSNTVKITGNCPVFFDILNAGKKSIAANAKDPEVAEVLKKLIATADVFFSNVRTGALKRLGLDYDSLKHNEKLVYAHLSGYGEVGPLASLPGYDGTAFFVRNGVYRDFTSPDNEPINHISALGDMVCSMSMAMNILAALMERNNSGRGCEVNCALNQTAAWSLMYPMILEQFGSFYQCKEGEPRDLSTYSMRCKDGNYIYYNAAMIKHWRALCKALGKENLLTDKRCATMSDVLENSKELYPEIAEAFLQNDVDTWIEILRAAEVPCEKYRHVIDMVTDEQLIANGFIRKCEYDTVSVTVPAVPVESTLLDDAPDRGFPLGSHTAGIMKSLGYTEEKIAALAADGKIIIS